MNQDAEESENVESQETEFDGELQDVYNSTTSLNSPLKDKCYIVWKEKEFQVSQALPEVPPPDNL